MIRKIEKGNGCSKDILLHHLLPNVICTGVISGKAKTSNINDKYIILERNPEDEILVNDVAMVVNRDVMASNGVIHIIDDVLIPETARYEYFFSKKDPSNNQNMQIISSKSPTEWNYKRGKEGGYNSNFFLDLE